MVRFAGILTKITPGRYAEIRIVTAGFTAQLQPLILTSDFEGDTTQMC